MRVDQHQFHGLLHSADLVETILRRELAPLGILPRQAAVIETLGRTGQMSQTHLANAFNVTSASMSTMTERLLAGGYITREVNPASRRQNTLELTDKGRTLLTGINAAWTAVDAKLRTILGEDADQFFRLSRRLRDGLGGVVPGTTKAPTV